MELISILVLAIALFIALIRVPTRPKGKRIKSFFMIVGTPYVLFFADTTIGNFYLLSLCAVNGGYTVNRSVNIDGYYDPKNDRGCDGLCLEALTRYNFKYYEANIKYDANCSGVMKKGFHKFYLREKGINVCAGGSANQVSRYELPQNKCVACENITAPTSKYEVSIAVRSNVWPSFLNIQKNFSYVKDRETGEVIGTSTSYHYWGGWVAKNSLFHNSASSCPSWESSHAGMRKVFMANR